MKLNQAFALRVREVLKDKKMTQYKLGQQTGLYHSTLTDILNCKYQTPNFKNIIRHQIGILLFPHTLQIDSAKK